MPRRGTATEPAHSLHSHPAHITPPHAAIEPMKRTDPAEPTDPAESTDLMEPSGRARPRTTPGRAPRTPGPAASARPLGSTPASATDGERFDTRPPVNNINGSRAPIIDIARSGRPWA